MYGLQAVRPYDSLLLFPSQIRELTASVSELSKSRAEAERRAAASEEKLRVFLLRQSRESPQDGSPARSVVSTATDRSLVFDGPGKVRRNVAPTRFRLPSHVPAVLGLRD